MNIAAGFFMKASGKRYALLLALLVCFLYPILAQHDGYQECIQNGDFEGSLRWDSHGFMVVNPRQGGGYAARMSSNAMSNDNVAYIQQQLALPDNIQDAIFTMDYCFEANSQFSFQLFTAGIYAGQPAQLLVSFGNINDVSQLNSTWQTCRLSLPASELNKIRQAQAQNLPIYFGAILSSQYLTVWLDNISFKAKGSVSKPTTQGTIAYLELDEKLENPCAIKTIQPDGQNSKTLWQHPDTTVPKISSIAWKPDGSVLAFASNHEALHSPFGLDIYTIKPDGSNLRRITNIPTPEQIQSGRYKMGKVTGQIYNEYGNVGSCLLYIQGAKKTISVRPYFKQTISFTVDEVADLGVGVNQNVILMWSSLSCPYGREVVSVFLDVIPGQTVDIGTIPFHGYCNSYECHHLSWKRDGSEIAFVISGGITQRVKENGSLLGELFSSQSAADLAYSPVNNQILYSKHFGRPTGIYMTQPGGGEGTLVVSGQAGFASEPCWMPDGSGLVYRDGATLYFYHIATQKTVQLTKFSTQVEHAASPSISPDGKYMVFYRMTLPTQATGNKTLRDLWIMDLHNPARIWQLTKNGRSYAPKWSPK